MVQLLIFELLSGVLPGDDSTKFGRTEIHSSIAAMSYRFHDITCEIAISSGTNSLFDWNVVVPKYPLITPNMLFLLDIQFSTIL